MIFFSNKLNLIFTFASASGLSGFYDLSKKKKTTLKQVQIKVKCK